MPDNPSFQNPTNALPEDQYGRNTNGLYDPVGHEIVSQRATNIGTDTVNGKTIKYGDIAGGGGGGLSTNDGSFAKETGGNLATTATSSSAVSTVSGTTSDTAYTGTGNSTINAVLRGLYALLAGILKVAGNVASGTADSGNPVKVGAIFNGTIPTFTSGQRTDLQADSQGNLRTNVSVLQPGDDPVADVKKVEMRFTSVNITTATTTIIMASPGLFHSLIINKHIANSTIAIYDNNAASGPKIGTIATGATLLSDPPITAVYNREQASGLCIVTSAASDITVNFRQY